MNFDLEPISRRSFLSKATLGAASMAAQVSGVAELIQAVPSPEDLILRISMENIEIAPGHEFATTVYNGSVAGDPIRLKEGRAVRVRLLNETDREEYVHWHGMLLPADLDGTEEEGSRPVLAKSKLSYSFTPQPAGLRFVHSHAMAMGDLERGMYSGQFAPVYVQPRSEPDTYDREFFISTHEWGAYLASEDQEESAQESELHRARHDREQANDTSSCCEVAYRCASINGKALGHGEPLRVRKGERVMFRIVNCSATEGLRLALPRHRFHVVALDGNTVPKPRSMSVLELGVGERIEALVQMDEPGVWIFGSIDPIGRKLGMGIVVEYAGERTPAKWEEAPESDWSYLQFGQLLSPRLHLKDLPISIRRGTPAADGSECWLINGNLYDAKAPPLMLSKRERYRLLFKNQTEEEHPLHLHRARFELLSDGGRRTGIMKDTVLVKGFQTVAVDFKPELDGPLLFHCHQQLHMDGGFKRLLSVRS